jgi:peroxiredoxin
LNSSFERSAPKVGELLPDIKALDADGKPLELRSLKGHYSVLVFGCLT